MDQRVAVQSKVHACPLTGIQVRRCPVKTCMWYSTHKSNGCMHGSSVVQNDSLLARELELEVLDMRQQRKAAQAKIMRWLVLDQYRSYIDRHIDQELMIVNAFQGDGPKKVAKYLDRILQEPQFVYGWSRAKLVAAGDKGNWRKFKSTLGEDTSNVYKQRTTLGLNVEDWSKMQRLQRMIGPLILDYKRLISV